MIQEKTFSQSSSVTTDIISPNKKLGEKVLNAVETLINTIDGTKPHIFQLPKHQLRNETLSKTNKYIKAIGTTYFRE